MRGRTGAPRAGHAAPVIPALIVIRGTGFADVLPAGETKLLTLVERLYELRGPVSDGELRALAESWKPFRTWAAVLIRAAARRVLGGEPAQSGTHPAGRRYRMGDTVATGAVAPLRAETVRNW